MLNPLSPVTYSATDWMWVLGIAPAWYARNYSIPIFPTSDSSKGNSDI